MHRRHRGQASLPQGIDVWLDEIGRLAGRLREQARSHSGLMYGWERLIGCQAIFAGKPRSHRGLMCGWMRLVGWPAAIASKLAPTVD
jgi:hypothetical protein